MSKIYIDYTSSVSFGETKVHGGGNYVRTIITKLKTRLGEQTNPSKEIVIIVPEGYRPQTGAEQELFYNSPFKIMPVKGAISQLEFGSTDTVLLPLLPVKSFRIIKEIKDKGPKVILTIHGLRFLDCKFDKYDLYYETTFTSKLKSIIAEASRPLKKIIYLQTVKKYAPYADTIITVSNYTLARLSKLAIDSKILLQYEGTQLVHNYDASILANCKSDFILFVSGNRAEKNLARTLEAFKQYVSRNGQYSIYIVGTNSHVREALIKNLSIGDLVEENRVVFFNYVTDEQLVYLYKCAKFLLYTSKSEGFGLPVLEAARNCCPSVAASGTSIPEVLGSNCIYVNPYSIESIVNGMLDMSVEETRERYVGLLTNMEDSTNKKIEDSNSIFFDELNV